MIIFDYLLYLLSKIIVYRVEYTDALGRSREVRRRDLPELEQQDEYLTGDHKKVNYPNNYLSSY